MKLVVYQCDSCIEEVHSTEAKVPHGWKSIKRGDMCPNCLLDYQQEQRWKEHRVGPYYVCVECCAVMSHRESAQPTHSRKRCRYIHGPRTYDPAAEWMDRDCDCQERFEPVLFKQTRQGKWLEGELGILWRRAARADQAVYGGPSRDRELIDCHATNRCDTMPGAHHIAEDRWEQFLKDVSDQVNAWRKEVTR